jgi:hypothetical protein
MRLIWILWGSDSEGKFIDGIYADKVRAEADMDSCNELYPDAHYWIQEKEITK